MSHLPVGFAECSAVFTIPGSGGPANVVTGHDVSGLATSLAVADAITAGWDAATPLVDACTTDVTLATLEIRWQAAAGDAVLISRTLNTGGGDPAPAIPPQVCYLLQKVTGFAGRKNRGRMYLPGVAEPSVAASGQVTIGKLTELAALAAAALSNWGTNGADLVILHTDPADTPRPVVEMPPSNRVATQRRRLR